MTAYSLYELNEYIKQVVALNFTDPIWISCELSQVKESRGNVYLDLIQHDDGTDDVLAQSSAAIWYKSHLFLRKKLGNLLPAILVEGTKVLLKVRVDFHERYGMKLLVEDIDPSYTIGQMEMARQKIIEKLKAAGIIERNKESTDLPIVLQSIAVISSPTAAGYIDFVQQLNNNEFGYNVSHDLYQAAMQGHNTEKEVCHAFEEIEKKIGSYDCVVLIRGGGSRLDLASFDNYNIGHKIATFPLPVLTGIGHEIDNTVADLVAHLSLKTPTAVASFIIDKNAQYESDIVQAGIWISQLAKQKIENSRLNLDQLAQYFNYKPMEIINGQKSKIDQMTMLLKQAAKYNLKEIKESLSYFQNIIKLADPINTMKRGYAKIESKDKIITSTNMLTEGEEIEIHFHDGKVISEISKITKNN